MAKMTLDDLVAQLTLVYGGGLEAVVLYGSAARGDRLAKRANLNVLVLVKEITMAHLRKESAVAAAWREAGNPPSLTLTMDEWRGSSDIFPIEYAERTGSSKIRATDFFSFIVLLLRIVMLFEPLRIFMPLGGALLAIGLCKLIYDITVWNLSETAVFSFLGALIIWSIGLIADMIARLHLRP